MSKTPIQTLRTHALKMAATLLVVGLLAGCGSSDNGATGNSTSQPEQSAKFSAKHVPDRTPDQPTAKQASDFKAVISGAVEGKIAWTGAESARAPDELNIMVYGGDDAGSGAMAKLSIRMPGKGKEAPVGTYPLKISIPNDPANPNDLAMVGFHPEGSDDMHPVQITTMSGGSGEVVITKSSPEEVSGTFQFTGKFMDRKAFKQREASVEGSFRAPSI